MGDATKDFNYSEFGCKCDLPTCEVKDGRAIHPLLLDNLQLVRDYYGKPIIVTSGCRCEYWNRVVGGVDGSYHLLKNKCKAVDIAVADSRDRYIVMQRAMSLDMTVGIATTFTHLDVRDIPIVFIY